MRMIKKDTRPYITSYSEQYKVFENKKQIGRMKKFNSDDYWIAYCCIDDVQCKTFKTLF